MSDELNAVSTDAQVAMPSERIAQVRDTTNGMAQSVYDAHRSSAAWCPQPPRRVDALARAVLFIMVKDECDIIGQNLSHHYALGFRRFFILDNASTDETPTIIREFRRTHADAELFYAYDFVVGHYQAAKMKALDAFMRAYLSYEDIQPEWLFLVDADEFITCARADHEAGLARFGEILNDPGKSLLVFHWVQCASGSVIQDLPEQERLFDAFPHTWPRMKVQVPKIAYRLGQGLSPIQGNHSVESFHGADDAVAVMAEAGFYLFHFPTRSVAQLRRKLINANKALSATKDRDGLSGTAGHWRTYYEWYTLHGDLAIETIIREHIQGCLTP